jgi:hypothetical protein
MKKTVSALLFSILYTIGFSSCQGPAQSQLPVAGAYDGFLLVNTKSGSQEQFLSGSLKTPSSGEYDFTLQFAQNTQTSISLTATVSQVSGDLNVNLSLAAAPLTMSWNASINCFTSGDSELCLNNKEISLHLTDSTGTEYVIVVDPHQATVPGSTETPQVYTVAQIIDLAKNQSFNSQIQFATAQESRENALTAHLNLLPNISLSNILSFLNPITVTGMISSIGDLAPFLLPSRWIAAAESSDQASADYYGWLIMKADSANIGEGLALSVLRDEASLAAMQKYNAPITQLRDAVQDREILGLELPGSSDSLTTVLEGLETTETNLAEVIGEEKTDLAQAIGLINANAVSDVTFSNIYATVDNPIQLDPPSLLSLVTDRALELKQIGALLSESKDSKANRFFYWMDPSVGAGANLGAGLPSSIEAGQDQINEIEAQQAQLQSTLQQTLQNTENEIQLALQDYKLANDSLTLQQQEIAQMDNQLLLGISVPVANLQNAYQAAITDEGNLIAAEYSYYVSLGKLNRLLYSGPYTDIESPNTTTDQSNSLTSGSSSGASGAKTSTVGG